MNRWGHKLTTATLWTILSAALLLGSGSLLAYPTYSSGDGETGNCATCHGIFNQSPYTSLSDGQNWLNDLHDIHRRDMLESQCSACHLGSNGPPVFTGLSDGTSDLAPLGCAGCHGREEDGLNPGVDTEGYGLGLQQHHWNADDAHPTLNLKVCGNAGCHIRANPLIGTPVGENVLPPHYADQGTLVDPPDDPCNQAPGFNENFAGLTIGLDNDGDGIYDEADPDCSVTTGSPGEASGAALPPVLVTSHNAGTRTMTMTYGAPCGTTDHTIEFGALPDVGLYDYLGQTCAIGNSGMVSWVYPVSPDSLYLVVVANDGSSEGSYGTDSAGVERPEDLVNASCSILQNLVDRCD